MDDWRRQVLENLLPENATRDPKLFSFSALELAMANARAEIAYLIEMGRFHNLPIMGGISGNDVWVRLGNPLLRFVHDRPAETVRVISTSEELLLRWDPQSQQLVGRDGSPAPFERVLRDSIDMLVRAWKTSESEDLEGEGPTSEHPTMA